MKSTLIMFVSPRSKLKEEKVGKCDDPQQSIIYLYFRLSLKLGTRICFYFY